MIATKKAIVLVLTLVFAAVAGCTREESRELAAPPTATSQADTGTAVQPAEAAAAGSLAGTSWQLVKIMSMDDTTYTPEDPSLYTLEFGNDGSMRLQADCNRGTGSWSSESPGQLQFGVIAATQAQCPPGSLHDQYLAQFQWVRSYVAEGGHLFLATMADGSIIEFEPIAAAAGN
jgi:heat shock protein HslJ